MQQILKPIDLGKIILKQRKKSKLSRNRLAALAGIGKTAIFDIEHGKTTYQIDTLFNILDVLNLKINISGIAGESSDGKS